MSDNSTLDAGGPASGWFLHEWMAVRGKRQADITRDLGWERGRVSKVYNGKQPYTRDDVAALAAWLQIRQHELLMAPEEAEHLRLLRDTALEIARRTSPTPAGSETEAPPPPRRVSTG